MSPCLRKLGMEARDFSRVRLHKYGSNSRKITCDVYLDDKACHADSYKHIGDLDLARIESALVSYADRVAYAC